MVDDKIASCGVGSIILSHYIILKQNFQFLIQHFINFINFNLLYFENYE